MYFRDPKKELPKEFEPIFMKIGKEKYTLGYYAAILHTFYCNDEDGRPITILGWVPISELDSIEIK